MKKAPKAHHLITAKGGRIAARKLIRPSTRVHDPVTCRPDVLGMLKALPLRGVERGPRGHAKHGRVRHRPAR